jgi:hypothetical protein
MQDALDNFNRANPGKVPKVEEIRTMGAQLMQDQVQAGKWFGFLDGKTPLYQMPVPEEKSLEIKADPYWAKNGITPNDNMIRRIFVAQEYQRLYGGAKKSGEVQFPPNAPVSQ